MNRSLLFVALALLFWGFGEGMFFNFVPIYLDRQFLLSEYQIGLVLGAFGFSIAGNRRVLTQAAMRLVVAARSEQPKHAAVGKQRQQPAAAG